MELAQAEVSRVLDILTSPMGQSLVQTSRIGPQVQHITLNLRFIQDRILVHVDERRKVKDATGRQWLESLKSIAYDIDDVCDEWSYNRVAKSRYITRKVLYFNLLSLYFCFPIKMAFRDRTLVNKINDLDVRLQVIAASMNRYRLSLMKDIDEDVDKQPGTPYEIDVPVKGRDAEKARLVNLLLAERSELISIVGMAGIGKTTLAQLVYNDEEVMTHFDQRIWVSVSGPLNKKWIAKQSFYSLEGHTREIRDYLEHIWVKIQESIEGKKFLLVLDDVWSEDPEDWKQLENFLIAGSSGSKLLVTTRKEGAAKPMVCIEKDILRVGLLTTDECWSLFCEIAFSGRPRKQLEPIGLNIVARCKGLPLAVQRIAEFLRFKSSKPEWESVSTCEFGKLEVVQKQIFGSLWLSYDDLPSSLKLCFLYCVIFPKGYRMSEDELVSLWMAHGFLGTTEGRDMEMVGHDFFHSLAMRSLFHDFEVQEKFNRLDKTYCKMHDMVHEFAVFVMENKCLHIEVKSAVEFTSSGNPAYISDDLYHLNLKLGEKVEFPRSFYNLRKLRSLIVLSPKKDSLLGAALPKIFDNFTCLRSLSLNQCSLETIPSNINKLIHLRWLKLSKNFALKELPEAICEMYNLQTLSVNWCQSLVHFPKGVERLCNLRHLKNDYSYCLLPKGIGKLNGLQKLLRITIDPNVKDAFSLRDLENLNNISGSLTIFFIERESDTLVEDAKQAQLEEKKHINALSINFPERAAEEWMQQQDTDLVEALKPPLSLEMLRITSYWGASCPSWINTLTSLKKLKLWYWNNCEHLPALAKLPCLEYIEFSGFRSVKKVTCAFYRMDGVLEASSSTAPLFPKLTSLLFMNMIQWEEWNDYDGDEEVMPCLTNLSIENCPNLKALPNFIRKKATLHKKIS